MPDSAVLNQSPPCLWVSAGLLTYRLCDRDFDCDHCPFDAALRRHPIVMPKDEQLQVPRGHSRDFPDDRRYTSGHWWIQVLASGDDASLRCGLDIFAAAVIGRCVGITWKCGNGTLAMGDPVCEIDFGLGLLSVGVPIRGTVAGWNSELSGRPDQVVMSPYDEGWIVELIAVDKSELDDLLPAQAARQKSQFDLHRFRRCVATRTLADDAQYLGRTSADGGELVADLRQILGGSAYVEMLRELIY